MEADADGRLIYCRNADWSNPTMKKRCLRIVYLEKKNNVCNFSGIFSSFNYII